MPAGARISFAVAEWRRWRLVARWRLPVALAALFVGLLLLDALLYQVTLPVVISSDGASLSLTVGGETQRLPISGRILAVSVPPRDPVIHEYQLDGTDSANNLTLDPAYLHRIANTPYYRFYAWMRDLDGLSRWRDLCAGAASGGATTCLAWPPLSGARLPTTAGGVGQRITVRLQRPETPATLALTMSDSSIVTLTVDRNSHAVSITRGLAGQPALPVSQVFFPTDTPPFAAMTLDFVTRIALWALAALGLVCGGELLLGYLLGLLRRDASAPSAASASQTRPTSASVEAATTPRGWLAERWQALAAAIHPVGLLTLGVSFGFVVWIALAQYDALPHIYDASAYLFGARTLAEGRLWAPAPAPAIAQNFPGPFMVIQQGRWFNQYEPGTSLTLALGVKLGVPWLVEPALGTLALLGLGLIARRLYDRRVATLAVLLGAMSPFYSYLAASYLSHTVALFYLVWGWWALLRWLERADRRGAGWYLPLAGLLWLLAILSRDTSVIFAAVAAGGSLWLGWRDGWPALRADLWRHWLAPALALLGIAALGLIVSLGYNAALTGSPFVSPRTLFFPGDHYGFGLGVGFYGQHTLAAGFITVDELMTSLAIDLFGWPFYLTLAFLLVPFLARRAVAADRVLLLGAAAMTFAFIGFYYHGIYLGPRYLYEALPFFLILTARGLVTLVEAGRDAYALGGALAPAATRAPAAAPDAAPPLLAPWLARGVQRVAGVALSGALLVALVACWSLYYLPRQITLHTSFTGMSAGVDIQMSQFEHPPLRNALVVTGDSQLYGYTLFGLNDPLLRGNVIYAEAASVSDYARLHRAFPTRALYTLLIDDTGAVHFVPVSVSALTP